MMTTETIFRQIDADEVEPIQQQVRVDFDNILQMPLGFEYRGRHHEVTEVIGSFRQDPDDPSVLYLVRTQPQQGVYALYLDPIERESQDLWRSRWVLHFRVEEEEGTMLVELKLKQVADFHGHLCPDLVIGYQASKYALDSLATEMLFGAGLRATVENTTSAVDAVQRLTGCTLGNRRLRLYDYGRHVYTFACGEGQGLRLALKPKSMPHDSEFLALEQKIQAGQGTMLETARYQALLDRRISVLLQPAPETLFDVQRIAADWHEEPLTSALVPCDVCGEMIVETHLVHSDGKQLCRPCSDGKRVPHRSG